MKPTRSAQNWLLNITASIALFSTVALADSAPIRLGYLLDLSGKGAFMGQQSQAGAELAIREQRSAGERIEIIYEDHRTEAKLGVSGARKLLDTDKVDGFLCDLTPPCIAASPILAQARRIMMYQAPVISILSKNPYAFKNFLDYRQGCKNIAEEWKRSGIKNIAHFKINAEFGDLCLQGAREVFPNETEYEYNANDDLRALVLRAKTTGVEAILQTGYESDYINRLREAAAIQFAVPTGMPEPLLTETVRRSVEPALLEGTLTFGFPELSAEFVQKLKVAGLYRSAVSIESAAIAYLHVQQLVAAIRACPDRSINCEVAAISSATSSPVLGFKGWDNQKAIYDYSLKRWSHGVLHRIDAPVVHIDSEQVNAQ